MNYNKLEEYIQNLYPVLHKDTDVELELTPLGRPTRKFTAEEEFGYLRGFKRNMESKGFKIKIVITEL